MEGRAEGSWRSPRLLYPPREDPTRGPWPGGMGSGSDPGSLGRCRMPLAPAQARADACLLDGGCAPAQRRRCDCETLLLQGSGNDCGAHRVIWAGRQCLHEAFQDDQCACTRVWILTRVP